MIGLFLGRVPNGEDRIANEVHHGALGGVNAGDGRLIIIVEQLDQVIRVRHFRDLGEVRDITEENADGFLFRAGFEQVGPLENLFDLLRRKIERQ